MKPSSSPIKKQKWLPTTFPSGGRINKPTNATLYKNNPTISFGHNLEPVEGNNEMAEHLEILAANEVSDNNGTITHDQSIFNNNQSDRTNKCDDKTAINLNDKLDNKGNEDSSTGSITSSSNTINSETNPNDNRSCSTTSSAQYSMNDNSENSESKRTLLNKCVKKVKSLMKK